MESLSKSVDSSNIGSGISNASARDSMIFSEGLAFPLVRSERKEMDISAASASSCLVIPRSPMMRRMFVKNIWL